MCIGARDLKTACDISFDMVSNNFVSDVMKLFLYRMVPHNGGAVFAKPVHARQVARIHLAIGGSSTWGAFRAAMSRKGYLDVIRSVFDDNCEPRPKAADEFSAESIPGWSDGDYPPWLQPEMDQLLPDALLRRFGERKNTALNGSFWKLPEENLPAICASLAALGWKLQHEPELPFH